MQPYSSCRHVLPSRCDSTRILFTGLAGFCVASTSSQLPDWFYIQQNVAIKTCNCRRTSLDEDATKSTNFLVITLPRMKEEGGAALHVYRQPDESWPSRWLKAGRTDPVAVPDDSGPASAQHRSMPVESLNMSSSVSSWRNLTSCEEGHATYAWRDQGGLIARCTRHLQDLNPVSKYNILCSTA